METNDSFILPDALQERRRREALALQLLLKATRDLRQARTDAYLCSIDAKKRHSEANARANIDENVKAAQVSLDRAKVSYKLAVAESERLVNVLALAVATQRNLRIRTAA